MSVKTLIGEGGGDKINVEGEEGAQWGGVHQLNRCKLCI